MCPWILDLRLEWDELRGYRAHLAVGRRSGSQEKHVRDCAPFQQWKTGLRVQREGDAGLSPENRL